MASLSSYSAKAARGAKVMTCKSCFSKNLRRFNSEINIHFAGLTNLDRSAVFVFPMLLVCMDCGFSEFGIAGSELCLLGKVAMPSGTSISPT